MRLCYDPGVAEAYDFVVIGSGPAGQRAAIQAAKSGARVCVIDRRNQPGGVCLHAGTIPSKTLREAVMHLGGLRQRWFYGDDYRVTEKITLLDLNRQVQGVLEQQSSVLRDQFARNQVAWRFGQAQFVDAHTLRVSTLADGEVERIRADKILIATGTVPRRPEEVPFDQEVVFDSNFVFSSRNQRTSLPRSLIVVGAGVIGTEYASIFASMGFEVWLVDRRSELLRFVDEDIQAQLVRALRDSGVRLRLGADIGPIERVGGSARVHLGDDTVLEAEALLFAMGRSACTEPLGIQAVGIETEGYGTIKVNSAFQTSRPHVYAAGDVIGFPALASTSAEQGRRAACHALGLAVPAHADDFPLAIYTIPEVSMVGRTEAELKQQGVPYLVGRAPYSEIPKANMVGDCAGMLKLLIAPDDHRLLGVHMVGELSCELIHTGQMVMATGQDARIFLHHVFNHPTLSEAYRIATFDALNRADQRPSD